MEWNDKFVINSRAIMRRVYPRPRACIIMEVTNGEENI